MNIKNKFFHKKQKKAEENSADTPEFHIRVISNSKIFPEELIKSIEEELGVKSVTRDPNEKKEEVKKEKKEKIKFNFDMVCTSIDLKDLTEKLKKSKISFYMSHTISFL